MSQDSPVRLLLSVIASVFIAEAVVMTLLFALPPMHGLAAALLDSFLLIILVAPTLYLFVLRPLQKSIAERMKAESDLAQRNRELATLNDIGSATCSLSEAPEILASMKDLLVNRAGFRAGTISSYDAASQELQLELSWGTENGNLPRGFRVPVGSCAFRQVLEGKQPQLFTRAQVVTSLEDSGRSLVPLLPGSHGWVGIPLVVHGEIDGLMMLTNGSSRENPDADHVQYWQAVGQIVGIAIHNIRLFAAEQHARQTAEVMRKAGVALTQSLDMATVMEALFDFTLDLIPYDAASIILVEDADHLAVHAARGCDCVEQLKSGRISLDREQNGLIEQMLASRQGRTIADVPAALAARLSPCDASMRSWLGVPFIAGENVLGIFGLGKSEPGFYTGEHLQLAETLAGQAAVAVQNAWLFAQLRTSRERLQTLSRQLVEVQENERAYVARELHDEAGQVLTSLMVGLRLLERDAQNPEATVAGVRNLKGMVEDVLDGLHRLAIDLRPASLDYLGLDAALRQHLETIAERNKITGQIETVGLDVRLPKDMEIALYRIVQEALLNVVRHAQATRVDVFLERRPDKLVAIVEDNGIGFNEEAALSSGRLGLLGMRERAEMLGGNLTIECGRSGGTTLLVEVPYSNPNPDCR